jgi:molybdate transport system substrate-binding protein
MTATHVPRVTALSALLLMLPAAAGAADIVVFCSNGYRTVMQDLVPEFQRTTSNTVAVTYDLSAALARRIEAGERFDLAILTPALVADLEAKGLVNGGTALALAVTPIGLAVKAGGARPNLQSKDAIRQTLLGATSIAFARQGAAAGFFLDLIARLDVRDPLQTRIQALASGAAVADAVASGHAQYGVIPVSEILPVAGISVGGTFPAELGGTVTMTSGLSRASVDAARVLTMFLTSPQAARVLQQHGMQRP